jgi:hypothetical protein
MFVAALTTLLAMPLPGGAGLVARLRQSPDSVRAACMTGQRLAQHVLTLETTLERDASVVNEFAPQGRRERTGCRVFGHTDEGRTVAPVDLMLEALQVEGWRPLWEYGADGPDGSLMGMSVGPVLCLLRGRWDGGDDSDTTYVPVPGYDLEITCFRRTPEDERR